METELFILILWKTKQNKTNVFVLQNSETCMQYAFYDAQFTVFITFHANECFRLIEIVHIMLL